MNRKLIALPIALALTISAASLHAGPVTMAFTPVGNPGNAADPSTGFGAVSYNYEIGTYDVTVNQYVAFLNANDPTGADPVGIYNSLMSDPMYGGVALNLGAPVGQKYSAASGDGIHPINFVTWYDAIRFANWMDNGEPIYNTEPTALNNATENGSYTLDGFTATPANGNSITRNPGAVVFLPSENEWYKAAYYDPATSSYFVYPTSSNTAPNATGPTAIMNSANYDGAVGNLTDVGAYTGTTSPYGAFDMGGDVWQWNEALDVMNDLGGGSFDNFGAFFLQSSFQDYLIPSDENNNVGFRLATVPEPCTVLLAVVACGGVVWLRKRFK